MSQLARKQQLPLERQPAPLKKTEANKQKRQWFTPGEKLLFVVFAVVVCFMGAKIISTEAAVYETNKQIQDVENKLASQKKINHDLQLRISEESTYEKIWKRAKELGLNLNEQNIKVVQPK
ncbi:MAG TPA: cell division protein FtsL [Chondromyces sp.]|nr:cell division protein FtsL [Chondromyces sp.]